MSTAPVEERIGSGEEQRYFALTHRQVVLLRFRKHKVAVVSLGVLAALYLISFFAQFLAPYGKLTRFPDYVLASPQWPRMIDGSGRFHLRPFVYGLTATRDPRTYKKIYTPDTSRLYPVRLFVKGESYLLFGLFPTDMHLFGAEGGQLFLFGTDTLGRDLFTRTIYGGQMSLTIGLVGVFLSLILGMILGGMAGYFGGGVDNLIMRTVDLLISIPTLPLWMGLAAAVPQTWSVSKTYFAITVILSVFGWTNLARVIRGKFLSLREEDFILAARLLGASDARIIARHLIPSFLSYIIVSLTLTIPNMIIGETVLSFLGLGLQAPAVSWGVLLRDAQNLMAVSGYPWLLLPSLFVIVTVLAFNFLGDGLRDAADPYGR